MPPLVLEGDTLGQKHRSYNKIVNERILEKITEINYEESDLDNLLKIDIACKTRNVDYILKVFQNEDMLFVSRAIKRSTWLITDPQYAQIINPQYFFEHLHPSMTTKAFNKLILHVRLNLKDEVRAEEFFNYYRLRNFNLALKWLQFCSTELTEKILEKHAGDIPLHMLKRLCQKSVTCLEIYLRSDAYTKKEIIASTTFYLKNHIEKYLTLIESSNMYCIPKFGQKKTKFIMTKCTNRVMMNIGWYSQFIHAPTFAKYIKREDMKEYILTNMINGNIRSWFTHNNIEPFVKRLPERSRFKFIKEIFIDRKNKNINEDTIRYCCEIYEWHRYKRGNESTSKHIYCWYKYAPFNIALMDLKKLIRSESSPSERTAIFKVLLTCSGKDMKNIHTLLKYYRENHINEPFIFKIQFVNVVLSFTDTHKFDKKTWLYLKDLFSSMEVYSESDKMVDLCVRSIILYNVIHDEDVPDIIQQKFLFDTFKVHQKKLSRRNKEKLFLFLYKYLTSKIETLDVDKEKECSKILELLENFLNLLNDWNKELEYFPNILDKIKKVIQSNDKHNWNLSLKSLSKIKKSWRKLLFFESFLLKPTQKMCFNALKHDPELLYKYKDSVEAMCLNKNTPTGHFLEKVRIYFSDTLANTYKDLFLNKLDQRNVCKATIAGLCTILPKREMSKLIIKYAPIETLIDRGQRNDLEFSIRKYIAIYLSIARPQPSPTYALLYAKGYYFKYMLQSLNSILYNISKVNFREYLPRLLKGPVSLQKLAIRVAFVNFNHNELKQLLSDMWESTKNRNIRADIFNKTWSFVCAENDEAIVKEMWQLLSMFIDNLTSEENKEIYNKLSKFENVPTLIKQEYWTKSYKFLKSLPPQANCDTLVAHLRTYLSDIIQFLDIDIVAEIFLESFDERFSTSRYEYSHLLSEFLLSSKTEEIHIDRNKKILVPLLERSLAMWDKTHKGSSYVQYNLQRIFEIIDGHFERIVLNQNMFMPISLYTEILTRLYTQLSIMEDYVIITTRKLALKCVKIFDRHLNSNKALKIERESPKLGNSPQWGLLYYETAPEIGRVYGQYLKEEINKYFPSIYVPFAEAFDQIFTNFGFNNLNKMRALKRVIEFEDADHFHLFVLKLIPLFGYAEELELKSEILDDIITHPSEEVNMSYWLLKRNIDRANVF